MSRPQRRWHTRALSGIAATLCLVGAVVARADAREPGAGDRIRPLRVASTSEPSRPRPAVATPEVAAPVPVTAVPPPVTGPLKVAFLGDSVAWSTAAAVTPLAGDHDVAVINAGIWGCGTVRGTPFRYFGATYDALPNDCDHWPEQWQAAIDREAPDVAVVMVGRWELMDRVHDGRWTHVGDPAFDAYLASELDRAISVAGSRGARVVVATTPYYRRGDAPGGGTWPEDDPARVDLVNGLLRTAAGRHPGVSVLEFGAVLSPEGRLAMHIGGVRVRTDGVHIATTAGPLLATTLLPAIRAAAGR